MTHFMNALPFAVGEQALVSDRGLKNGLRECVSGRPIWLEETVAALKTIQYLKPIFNLTARDPQEVGRQPKDPPPVPHLSNRTVLMRSIGGGCGQLKERRELRSCLELRDWVEVLESARERVG